MNFDEIRQIQDETEQVNRTYELFCEDERLSRSPAARVEFLTTLRYIEKYLRPGARILDLGAGTGAYSLYFAARGYEVDALELAENNIRAFREKLTPGLPVRLVQGNALDLSRYPDESFDVVLCFGPLYHLHEAQDRDRCIREAMRVCKSAGVLFFAFINHDAVFLSELSYRGDYFDVGDYDKETLRLHDFPFVFHTVAECRDMLTRNGLRLLHAVASDGVSELMEERINAMTETGYAQYLRYHDATCEKPEMLGRSNHLLFAAKKAETPQSKPLILPYRGLILRDFQESDIDSMLRWCTGHHPWMDWDAPWEPVAEVDAEKYRRESLQHIAAEKSVPRWSLQIEVGGVHIGYVGSYRIGEDYGDVSDEDAETKPWYRAVGLDILDDRCWNRGWGTVALEGWLFYLRAHGVSPLYLQTWSGNERMIHVAEKLGFRECSRRVGVREWQGKRYDALTFRLDDAAYLAATE